MKTKDYEKFKTGQPATLLINWPFFFEKLECSLLLKQLIVPQIIIFNTFVRKCKKGSTRQFLPFKMLSIPFSTQESLRPSYLGTPKYSGSLPAVAGTGCLNILTGFAPALKKHQFIVSYHFCKVEKLMCSDVQGQFKKSTSF